MLSTNAGFEDSAIVRNCPVSLYQYLFAVTYVNAFCGNFAEASAIDGIEAKDLSCALACNLAYADGCRIIHDIDLYGRVVQVGISRGEGGRFRVQVQDCQGLLATEDGRLAGFRCHRCSPARWRVNLVADNEIIIRYADGERPVAGQIKICGVEAVVGIV